MCFTRKIMVILSVLPFLLLGSQSMAAQADPKGAYDLFWGESIQAVKEKITAKKWTERKNLDEFKQLVTILPPNQASLEYSAKMDGYSANIMLHFRDNHLFEILVHYVGKNQKRDGELKQVLIERYGSPTNQGPSSLVWEAGDTRMLISKLEVNRKKSLETMLFYVQISSEAKASKEIVEHIKNRRKKTN